MKRKISPPLFEMELQDSSVRKHLSQSRIEACIFRNEDVTYDCSGKEFFECRFEYVSFHDMRGCLFADCVFDHCDFSNADFHEAMFRRVHMVQCRMTGTDMSRCTFQDTVLENCQAVYCNFSASKMKLCEWKETVFREAALSMCTLAELSVTRCDFTSAEFLDTSLNKVDLSSSKIDGISVGMKELKGVIMNEEQALACIKLLGIQLKRQ